jgi:hypothetical protein
MSFLRVPIYVSILVALVCQSSALAHGPFQTTIDDANSPIRLDECRVESQDADGVSNFYIASSVSFTNLGPETATAVRFKFDISNPFGDYLGSKFLTQEGTFSPGARIAYQGWHEAIANYGSSGTAKCSVDTVRFSDGTVWQAGEPAPQAASGTASGASDYGGDPALISDAISRIKCQQSDYITVANILNAAYLAHHYAALDAASAKAISVIRACEPGAQGRALGNARLYESLSHSWRAIGLLNQHIQHAELIKEYNEALAIETLVLADPSMASDRESTEENYQAILKRRNAEIAKPSY